MRIAAYFLKTFRENLREWKILVLALVFGPFFVFLMYFYYGAASPSYNLAVLDQDQAAIAADGSPLHVGRDVRRKWAEARYPDGKPIFRLRAVADEPEGRRLLESREADLLVAIPAGLSRTVLDRRSRSDAALSPLKNVGDPSSVRFMVAASFADYISYAAVAEAAGIELPSAVVFQAIGSGRSPSDFDLYVPALLVLAIIMVMFTAAASIIKEVDKGTITRLMLSRLRPFDFLTAVSLNQVLIGTAALGLTYASAVLVGYRGRGSLLLILLVGILALLGVIAVSVIVAAWMRTIFELLTVGVFPFFILMFFSESMFALPRITLVALGGHSLYLNDILPTALAVKAFNKILNFGAGPAQVGFEIIGIVVLTILYFAVGLWLFHRRHLRPR